MAIVNPFRQINASLPPLAPAPPPPTNELGDPLPDSAQKPAVFADAPAPKPTPQDRQETMLGNKLEQDYQKDLHPWGTPENHPGVWGKIAHGLSVARGLPEIRAQREQGLEGRLNKLAELQSQDAYRGAETGKTQEETAEMPGKAQSEEDLQKAQTGEAGARTTNLENPPEEWKAIPQVIGPNGEPVEIEGRSGQIRFGGVSGLTPEKQPKPDTPEQQYIDEYQRLHKGSTVAQAERSYSLDTQKPPQMIMLTPGPNGRYSAQNIKPGSQVAGDAISPGGLNTINTPTSQSRNMAEMAATVLPMAQSVKQEIASLAQSIGPAAGRWNELMVNKGGADFPEFSGLDTDLDLLSSAIVRTHFGARGGQQYREELRKMLGEAQSPDDLLARIDHADGWLEGYAHMNDRGKGGAAPPVGHVQAAPPQGADVQVKGADGKMYWGDSKTKQVLGPVQ